MSLLGWILIALVMLLGFTIYALFEDEESNLDEEARGSFLSILDPLVTLFAMLFSFMGCS
ncbi:MAG: hypothetical protein U9N49_11740 [Campylobacterota bacterium]|nr:hypothetical protein [Campylobacterota bacterium]